MTAAEKIIAAAMACINTPFVHQGRVPGVGLDCAGLGIICARAIGVEVTDFKGYPRLPFDGMLKKMFDEQPHLREVPRAEMQAGDVLLMRISTAPQHVAVYVGGGFMVHAYQAIGKVVQQRLDESWRNKIIAVYRFAV